MKRIFLVAILSALLGASASGCSDSGNQAIVGDWFECSTISCEDLKAGGHRFRADGTWVLLAAKGATLDDGEKYCLKHGVESQGAYSWDGKILKMTTVGKSKEEECGFEVTGSDATRTNLATSSYVKLRGISDPRASGFCGSGSSDGGVDATPSAAKNDGVPPVILDSTPYFPDF